ncbi:hypothetical protein LOD99_6867 [Oopsacas minuta]|uniref:Uncharacterized protein n=1 Tax=Oopsacas minuta TaxID=111878 RepID=A0AAV7JKP0_9METZ|nr:hypothetical protein LOD99_6867 [Oopsacas minuta]
MPFPNNDFQTYLPDIGMSAHSTIPLAEQSTEESDTDLNSTPMENANSIQTFQLKNTVRTVDDILRIRKICSPEHMSQRPWKSTDEAKVNLDSWAYNLHVGGGRFSLIWGGQI